MLLGCNEACAAGAVSEEDIRKATLRGYVRMDIREASAAALALGGHATEQHAAHTRVKPPRGWRSIRKRIAAVK